MGTALLIVAAAGGGSAGYGGGGGGGGGGGYGGGGYGGGGSGGGCVGDGCTTGGVIFFAFIALLFLLGWLGPKVSRALYLREVARRDAEVKRAAREAAEDDADFDPDRLRADALSLFTTIQERWTARDRAGLAELVSADLMAEWTRRLDDFDAKGWHNVVHVARPPKIRLVGLVNREGEADDRVVVRIDCLMEDYVENRQGGVITQSGSSSTSTRLREWWILGQRDDRWYLHSIEADDEGRHHLAAELVATPWADDRVADESLVELAVADAALPGFATADLVDPDFATDARAAALDLSLADARFGPDLLAIAARRAVEAWVEAVDGSDAALEALATPEAIAGLLHAGDLSRGSRVVMRGGRVESVTIAELHPSPEPARMVVDVAVEGVRYVEDRDTTAVLAGDKDSSATHVQRWTFALDGEDATPWRLVAVS